MSSYRDDIAAEIVARIEAGTAPWQQPWQAGTLGAAPFNPATGKSYRGINDLWLSLQGRADPRWMTYNQAAAAGLQVRKGAKGSTIEYWQWTERTIVRDAEGKPVLDDDGKQKTQEARLDRPRVHLATVFNAEQIDGLEPFAPPVAVAVPQLVEHAEALIAGAGVPVFHDQSGRAFYRPSSDEIHLPPLASFKDQVGYYETVLHELGHATGHSSRLNRDFGPFGGEKYAREELRAEISSYMLARDMGISFDPSNHAAYVESWLHALREDKNEIFRAARDAEMIKTWVMEPERRPELERAAGQQRMAQARTEAEGREQMVRTDTGTPAPAASRTYITVPYAEKDAARALGAKWDRAEKSWYVPEGQDPAAFAKWSGAPAAQAAEPVPAQKAEGQKAVEPTVPRVYLDVNDAVKTPGAIWDKEAAAWYAPEGQSPAPASIAKSEPVPAPSEQPKPRTYLAVPFAEKDAVKSLGAKWDRAEKSWYVPEGQDPTAFVKWSVKGVASTPALSPQEEFAGFLKANNLVLDGAPEMDGKWHSVPTTRDKGKEKSGSYRGFLDGRPAGQVTAGWNAETVQWVSTGVALTDEERARIQAEAAQVRANREAERQAAVEQAAKTAYGVWKNLPETPAGTSPYLDRKGVGAHGVKIDGEGKVVVPARDAEGKLWTLQFIGAEGKLWLKESQKSGSMHVVEPTGAGTLDSLRPNDPVIIAEGYATAARIFEASKRPVVVAFDCGNLLAVAEAVHAKFPDRPILLAADNDHARVNAAGVPENIGILKAQAAAKVVGGQVVAPQFTETEKAKGLTDFDDLGKARGNGAVRQSIEGALARIFGQERGVA